MGSKKTYLLPEIIVFNSMRYMMFFLLSDKPMGAVSVLTCRNLSTANRVFSVLLLLLSARCSFACVAYGVVIFR